MLAFSSSYGVKGHRDQQGERNDNGYPNSAWLTAIHDFKAYQEGLLEHLRESIASTYKKYEPEATALQEEMLFSDKEFRSLALARMETARRSHSKPEATTYWHEYVERFRNFDQLKLDLLQSELLCAAIASDKGPNVSIREYDIAANGDTILEFANSVSEAHPVLRFRVSSHILVEASPFFARILSSRSDPNSPLEMLVGSPPPPLKQGCRDGTEVKVYRMPQLELNKFEALTTLLHAAHMHNDQIPRQIKFDEFVSIAEVCLRYQCTSPLEMAVEYRWLPQWIHKANEASPDGFLLITYVFGLGGLFHRTSKSAILNIVSDKELERKELWPQEVKDKIAAVREAKLAQIYASCASLMREYVRTLPHIQTLGKDDVSLGALTSTPKCPKGLHQCDAANLGWLMLVFNELGILPVVMDTVNGRYPFIQSRRSIISLVQSLRRMPSAPQLHSGVCDYAPAFRSIINDIYNSINGLTLWDVSGIDGWALSKKRDSRTKFRDDVVQEEVFELPALVTDMHQKDSNSTTAAEEAVRLRILSYLEDLQDLHSMAMVNKSFYSTFKKHELTLMRNLIKTRERKVTMTNGSINGTQGTCLEEDSTTPQATATAFPGRRASADRAPQPQHLPLLEIPNDDLYEVTPPTSPFKPPAELHISATEVEEILWPHEKAANGNRKWPSNGGFVNTPTIDPDSNAKFLSRDVVHVDKSLVIEGRKHLRDEQDTHLRMGVLSVSQTS